VQPSKDLTKGVVGHAARYRLLVSYSGRRNHVHNVISMTMYIAHKSHTGPQATIDVREIILGSSNFLASPTDFTFLTGAEVVIPTLFSHSFPDVD